MIGLWDVSPMNKTHQVWQRLNIMLCGFLMGQIYHVPERFTLWLPLVWLVFAASTILEMRFNKRDVSGWRTDKLRWWNFF